MSDRATLTEAPSLQVIVPGPAVFLRQGAVDGGFAVEAEFVEGRLTWRGQPAAARAWFRRTNLRGPM